MRDMRHNQWTDHAITGIKIELMVMEALLEKPSTLRQLEEQLNLPHIRLRNILTNLKKSGCVERIESTHLNRLVEL